MEHAQWQHLLKQGNEYFHDHRLVEAEHYYCKAYELLDMACQSEQDSVELLMAWVCACHNLSSLYEIGDNLDLSLKFLIIPHQYLVSVSRSENINDEIKLNALKGMGLTLPPILLFRKKYLIGGNCQSQLSSLDKIIEHDGNITH